MSRLGAAEEEQDDGFSCLSILDVLNLFPYQPFICVKDNLLLLTLVPSHVIKPLLLTLIFALALITAPIKPKVHTPHDVRMLKASCALYKGFDPYKSAVVKLSPAPNRTRVQWKKQSIEKERCQGKV